MALLALVTMPVIENWKRKPKDSFPLSYYPMFSQNRDGRTTLTYILGSDQAGNRHFIPYHRAGTGGMNQVRKIIRKQAEYDPTGLCQRVAKAVSRQNKAPDIRIDTVRIIRGEFILDHFFAGNHVPERSEEICACAVERKSSHTQTDRL